MSAVLHEWFVILNTKFSLYSFRIAMMVCCIPKAFYWITRAFTVMRKYFLQLFIVLRQSDAR